MSAPTRTDDPRPREGEHARPTTPRPHRPGGAHRHRARAASVGVALLAVAVAVYLAFFASDAPRQLELASDESPPATLLDVPAGTWSVAPAGSLAGYRVRQRLLGLPASDAVGRTGAVTGSFHLSRDQAGFSVTRVSLQVDVSTLKSDDARRDHYLRTHALETDRFPTATFVSTAPLLVPDALGALRVYAVGDLTVHGRARPVTIPIDVQRHGRQIEVVGSMSFPWSMFEMETPNLPIVSVQSAPTLEFRLLFEHRSTVESPTPSPAVMDG